VNVHGREHTLFISSVVRLTERPAQFVKLQHVMDDLERFGYRWSLVDAVEHASKAHELDQVEWRMRPDGRRFTGLDAAVRFRGIIAFGSGQRWVLYDLYGTPVYDMSDLGEPWEAVA
jgi:hypothetical protein